MLSLHYVFFEVVIKVYKILNGICVSNVSCIKNCGSTFLENLRKLAKHCLFFFIFEISFTDTLINVIVTVHVRM